MANDLESNSPNVDRLAELRKKDAPTDTEMQELIALSPAGEFKTGPNVFKIGVIDVDKFFNNLREGPTRTKHALTNGCYLEVISLRLQHAEFWLRMFWVAKNGQNKIFDATDKRTFGQIINDCKNIGFPSELVTRLQEFNRHRIDAIHKYLLGATDYEELRIVCEKSAGLDGEVGEFVRNEVGIFI